MTLSITLEQPDKRLALFGSADRYLRMIRDTFGVQIVNRANGVPLLSGGTSNSPALAVYDPTGYRITGPYAGTTDFTKTAEYSFAAPVVSMIAVTNGNVGSGASDTPRISAGRYVFY